MYFFSFEFAILENNKGKREEKNEQFGKRI